MPMTGTSSALVIALPDFVGHALKQDDVGCRRPADARPTFEHLLRLLGFPALHAKPADLVHGLRLKPEVRADRDIVPRQVFDDLDLAFAALQLDHHRPAFLHQAHGSCRAPGLVSV